MDIHFLGTAASEGIPNPFCSCTICEQSRQTKGKNIRTRSAAIIDETMQIDLAPEFSYQVMKEEVDVRKVQHLLFTHTHPDHFNVGDLFSRMEGYGHHVSHPLHIYGNDRAINGCLDVLPNYSDDRFSLTRFIPFETMEIGDARVTPLLANHAQWEMCFVYFIEKSGKTLFYGHDSGWFPESTWKWLQGKTIDLTILECTWGYTGNDRDQGHMGIETVLAAKDKLLSDGIHGENSRLIVSHISHNSKLLHDELVDIFAPHDIQVAFDGMKVSI